MPVVAIKGGRLTEYQGGKSISIGNNSTMQINPDIPKAHQLRGWYDSLSDQHQFSNISNKSGGDGNAVILFLLNYCKKMLWLLIREYIFIFRKQ